MFFAAVRIRSGTSREHDIVTTARDAAYCLAIGSEGGEMMTTRA
jgi:hypothetical protein